MPRSSVVPHSSADVDVRLWDLGEFQERDAGLPFFVNPEWIIGQLAMTTVSIGQSKTKVWATIDLSKVRILRAATSFSTELFTVILFDLSAVSFSFDAPFLFMPSNKFLFDSLFLFMPSNKFL
jgi:hypothetical protein